MGVLRPMGFSIFGLLYLLIGIFERGAANQSGVKHGEESIPFFEIHKGGVLREIHTPHSTSPRHRSKRSPIRDPGNSDQRTKIGIDLLVLADHSVFDYQMEENGNHAYSAESAIHKYISAILHEVGRIYSAAKTDNFRFQIHPIGIVLAKKVKQSPWVWLPHLYDNETRRFNVDAFEVLQSLKKWVEKHSEHLPAYDHVVAITKKDLSRFEDNLAQGIAYVRSICRWNESLSVVEDVGAMATVSVVAHEIAHSLGAEHDGTTNNRRCTVDENYLMVPSVSGSHNIANSFAFSACTLNQIDKYLRKNKNNTACLYRSPTDVARFYGAAKKKKPAGQIYSVDQQCQQTFGQEYRFCGDKDYHLAQLCRHLWCRNTEEGRYGRCYTINYLPAFYGTTCGHKMWCVYGACVEDRKAPTQSGCKFGDKDSRFCANLIHRKPKMCDVETFRRFCCQTCHTLKHFRRLSRTKKIVPKELRINY